MKYKAKINIALAHNLRSRRNSLNLTQEKFAEKAGVSCITISKIETQDQWPSPETLEKIAKTLNIQTYQLFINDEEMLLPAENLVVLQNQFQKLSNSFDSVLGKKQKKDIHYNIKHK